MAIALKVPLTIACDALTQKCLYLDLTFEQILTDSVPSIYQKFDRIASVVQSKIVVMR